MPHCAWYIDGATLLSPLQVHPNHQREAHLKLKHYEFAGRIVGKCLYESAMSNTMLVKARFTRSFLAQIIGLRVHHKVCTVYDADVRSVLTVSIIMWCITEESCCHA